MGDHRKEQNANETTRNILNSLDLLDEDILMEIAAKGVQMQKQAFSAEARNFNKKVGMTLTLFREVLRIQVFMTKGCLKY